MSSLWDRYQQYLLRHDALGITLDISRMRFGDDFLSTLEPSPRRPSPPCRRSKRAPIANPDEKRMVGHYWLRAPQLAPTPELKAEIEQCNAQIQKFVAQCNESGRFTDVLVIGIGGSALGPQLSVMPWARRRPPAPALLRQHRSNGMDRVLASLHSPPGAHLCVVISKSGGPPRRATACTKPTPPIERPGWTSRAMSSP